MSTPEHQLELVQAELSEALNDIERYERVAVGNYTEAELKDKGEPIQLLARTYEQVKSLNQKLAQLQSAYDNQRYEIVSLKARLEEALTVKKSGDTSKKVDEKLEKLKADFYASTKNVRKEKIETVYTSGSIGAWSQSVNGAVTIRDTFEFPWNTQQVQNELANEEEDQDG